MKIVRAMRKKIAPFLITIVNIIAAVFLIIIFITILISAIKCEIKNLDFHKILIEVIGVFVALIGVNMVYDKFKEKQDEAIFGFYTHMHVYLESIKLFLGPKKREPKQIKDFDFTKANVVKELLHMKIKENRGYVAIDEELKLFKIYSKQFYKFLLESKDNIPPTDDIMGWYEGEKKLVDFLLFGISCDKKFYARYDENECEMYYNSVVESIIEISNKIDTKITELHNERNPSVNQNLN
jgi:hypothetical protein